MKTKRLDLPEENLKRILSKYLTDDFHDVDYYFNNPEIKLSLLFYNIDYETWCNFLPYYKKMFYKNKK